MLNLNYKNINKKLKVPYSPPAHGIDQIFPGHQQFSPLAYTLNKCGSRLVLRMKNQISVVSIRVVAVFITMGEN